MRATNIVRGTATVVAVRNVISLSVCLGVLSTAVLAHATTIADWTFETSQPATAGPFAPEVGSGSATGFHSNGAAVYSNPAGNGSSHSFSANTWTVGDYYQCQVSTVGLTNINLTWDETSSSTGPRDYILQYSTNGTSFTNFGSTYSPIINAASGPNAAWNAGTNQPIFTFMDDLSSIAALNSAPTVYFRMTDADTTAENGGTVALAGTDRVDNVIVSGILTPEPSSLVLAAFGIASLVLVAIRRR